MQTTDSQFTWSPAEFAAKSGSSTQDPSTEASDSGEVHISTPRARLPTSMTSSNDVRSTSTSNNKENVPLVQASPMDDPSAPVQEFLRSLNPNLEQLLPRFRELGIEDVETLLAFKTWTVDEREELLRGELNKLQLLAVQNFLKKAD